MGLFLPGCATLCHAGGLVAGRSEAVLSPIIAKEVWSRRMSAACIALKNAYYIQMLATFQVEV